MDNDIRRVSNPAQTPLPTPTPTQAPNPSPSPNSYGAGGFATQPDPAPAEAIAQPNPAPTAARKGKKGLIIGLSVGAFVVIVGAVIAVYFLTLS